MERSKMSNIDIYLSDLDESQPLLTHGTFNYTKSSNSSTTSCKSSTNTYKSSQDECINKQQNKSYSYSLTIASLSNDLKCSEESIINDNSTNLLHLDAINMSYKTFRSFFYSDISNAFHINPAKKLCFQIAFNKQTVSDSDGTHTFDLLDHILCVYESEKNTSRNSISSKEMIALTKEILAMESLFEVCGCVTSLKWTDILDMLKSNGLLSTFGDKVCFKITCSYTNTKLFQKPIVVVFNYLVCDIYENYILSQTTECTYLLNNMQFSSGTYRITRPGTYILTENIVFNPNRYDNHKPRINQYGKYPPSNGYVMGFFAAITVETENVIIDLNGFSISLHNIFNLKQRFCALIELASTPFVPKQGPADFGSNIISAYNVVIKNGILGQVSHHGIHGNGCKNILIENIEFSNFEVAAISINGGEHITVNNCRILHTNIRINVMSTYSHAKFGLPKLKQINKNATEPLFLETHYSRIPLQQIEQRLENEIIRFERNIEASLPVSNSIFHNPSGLYDGNVYGIVFNSYGVVIGDFKPMRDENVIGNKHINILNTSIENIVSDATEVASLRYSSNTDNTGYGSSAFVGGAGDVFNFLDSVDVNGYYRGNIIGDMQMAICQHGTGESRGTGNIPPTLCIDWIKQKKNIMELINTVPTKYDKLYSVNRDKDSMAHSMKGNIGLFISQGMYVTIDNVYINNIVNRSKKLERTISTQAIGIAIVGSKEIRISDNIRIKQIRTSFGNGEYIKYINM